MAVRVNARALHLVGDDDGVASSKYYLIGARDNEVHIKHGRMDIKHGKIEPVTEQKHMHDLKDHAEARAFVENTVKAKIDGGYRLTPPSMRPELNVFSPKTKRIQSKKRVTLDLVQKQIRHVEEFEVEFGYLVEGKWHNTRDDRSGLANYNAQYERRLDGTKTIKEWKGLRIARIYPEDLDVRVYDGRGNAVSPRTSLKSVRKSYTD